MPRKYLGVFAKEYHRAECFNEAGADAPEIPRSPAIIPRPLRSFNEAGADAPEIPTCLLPTRTQHGSFNEAGADAPEIPSAG